MKYGILRDSSLDVITVREHFNPKKLVKTYPGTGNPVLNILKMNMTKKVRTGIYEYVQMGSVFIDRNKGHLVKLSTVSTEWCGNSFALYERFPDSATLKISNYFDDLGTSKTEIRNPQHTVFL
ncbi:MAG: hypothetical protein GKR87_02985 [Kiritimatiellae bacterium]|nr:hypothetical protein [Kiritimatiellia bacterium]